MLAHLSTTRATCRKYLSDSSLLCQLQMQTCCKAGVNLPSAAGEQACKPQERTCSSTAHGLQEQPELFRMARVGLGALGVVTQLTLQCVPAHRLVERTYVTDIQARPAHFSLSSSKHASPR